MAICRNNFNVKRIIFFTLFSVIILHLLSSIPSIYRSFEDYNQASKVKFLNDVSDDLYKAVENYGFERGRVNVVLNDAGPVEKMENNRNFIITKQRDGDNSLKNAISKLHQYGVSGFDSSIEKINLLKIEIEKQRQKVGKDLILLKDKRENGAAGIWFNSMTQYIESIEELLVMISNDISDADGVISRYSSLKHEALSLRNTAGPEMSILSATILSEKPIAPELAKKIEVLQVSTRHHLQNLTLLSNHLKDNKIPESLKIMERVYNENYLPYRNTVFPLALKGGPYPYSQSEFLENGVKALSQISIFMETVVGVTRQYAENKLNDSKKRIIMLLSSSAGSLGIIILILFFVHFRVIRPIALVTSVVRRLAQKDLTIEVPLKDVQNEIGEMARAVEVFKGMALQLEEDLVSLQIAEGKIRYSEERFRTVADFSYDWEYWVGPGGQLKYISPSCERITGYKPEEFETNSNLLYAICLTKDEDAMNSHFESYSSQNEPSASLNFQILRKDGGLRWINHICQPITGSDGQFLGRRVCNRDITDHKLLEDELVKAKKLEATAILAGGIAHDFNNLLTAAMGNIELAEEGVGTDGLAYKFLSNAQSALLRASDLASKFITFSSGGMPLKKLTDINIMVNRVVSKILNGTNIHLQVTIPSESWKALVDDEQISQVINDIVENSIEAMPDGGNFYLTIENIDSIELENSIILLPPGDKYIKITFKDEGVGISESNLDKVFDPYFSTKAMGAKKGMGLGLTIAHSIIRKHNGFMKIDSRMGHGTSVIIYIPSSV
jgi:PAS domain S-box-containing protein